MGIDKHGKSAQCITNIVYEDYEEPQIQCPDIHIDLRSGTTSKYVPIKLPIIETKDSSAVHIIYSPPNNTVIEIDYPLLVNVTAIDAAGNLAQCQFWYMAVASDCPLWKIDTTQFICTQSENITVCHRRIPCLTRELPLDFKAIVCIPGQRWRFVQDVTPSNRLSETHEMIRTPYCLEQEASNITLSITFRTQTIQPSCSQIFVTSTQNEMNNFVNRHCPNVGWNFLTKDVATNFVTFNFSTTNSNTESVLLCISEITNSLTRELPQAKIECAPLIKSHTITYHVYCSHGWGANTNLRCEKCPPGYFSIKEVCVPCPIGTYSGGYSSRECLPCEGSTSTINEGAISSDECLPLCGLGYYSSNGLAPCRSCPKGSYQSQLGGTTCVHCPFNTTTIKIGTHFVHECQPQCSPGHYSTNVGGTEPCLSCPKGFFQNNFGSEICEKCPDGTTTYLNGATSYEQCIELNCQYTGCKNGGICIEGKCKCQRGYAGYDCSVSLNLCNAAYCLNDAICQFTQNKSVCICKEGFNGTRYETNLSRLNAVNSFQSRFPVQNSQFSNTCLSSINNCINGKCNLTTGGCDCNTGFYYNGSTCVQQDVCQFVNACFTGKCTPMNLNQYSCTCDNGLQSTKSACAYLGDCDTDTDCNNGTCLKYINWQDGQLYGKCFCNESYVGINCNVEVDACSGKPETCQNCVEYGVDLYCDCPDGNIGEYCEIVVDPCYSEELEYYCLNGGKCNSSSGNATCECPEGWSGEKCETFNNYFCDEQKCTNGAECIPLANNYTCQCPYTYYGYNCENYISACFNVPEGDGEKCGKHGNCSTDVNNPIEYSCECDVNWNNGTEKACLYPEDLCDENTCVNGECKTDFEANTTVCLCEEGYMGVDCNTSINYCPNSVDICHPATCQNTTGGYICICDSDICKPNPCSGKSCGNGICIANGTDNYYCSCQLNYEGEHCERNISYCKTHVGICNEIDKTKNNKCVDTLNGGYCECGENYYGSYCEHEKDRNFDLYFTGRKGNQSIESMPVSSTNINGKEFTLCLWVRPGANAAIETNAQSHFRMKAIDSNPFLNVVKNNANRDILISITSTSITVKGKTENYNVTSPGGWYHLCLQTMHEPEKQWVLFVNGNPQIMNFEFFEDASFSEDILIVLAPPNDNNVTFQGEMSFVELYNIALDSSIIANAVANCLDWSKTENCADAAICWTNYTTVTRFNTEIINIRPGICYFSNCMVGSADCINPNDRAPPQIVHCPKDMFHPSNEPYTQVGFKMDVYDMFTDQSPITNVTSNFRNGQYFEWGQYRIIITATDYKGNTATCQFTLTVYPEKNDNVTIPDDNTLFKPIPMNRSISDQIRYISAIECISDEYVIAKDYAPFYVCDIMGQWQRYASALQTEFNVPQCVKSVEGHQTLNGTLTIIENNKPCESLRNEIKETINQTDVCKKGCEIVIQPCPKSFKRATDADFSIQFFVSTNTSRLAVKPNVVKALETHFRGASKVEVNNSEITCINNYQEFPVKVENEKNAVCSTVPMGSFWDQKLEYCPKNTFKNFTGPCTSADECCISCPDGEVTAMHGSLSPNDCYKNCSIGSFYNEDISDCQQCPKGSYQGFPGMRYCERCSKFKTTNQTGSININQCIKCNPGQEIGKNGDCIDCPIGTYSNESADSCIPCDKGLTTGGLGSSTDSHCNVVSCVPGSQIRNFAINVPEELVFAKNGCQYCEQGKYQVGFNQSHCLPCGDGFTTLARNASTFNACVAITDLTCSKNQDCEKINKDYECICKEHVNGICTYKCGPRVAVPINTESQLWWISLLIAFFVLLLVIVVVLIVWRKHMLSCCCSMIPSWLLNFFPEKLKTGMPGMRVSTLRRSRPSSMVSIPDDMMENDEENKEPENISLPRLALQKTTAKSISNHSEQEEETCLDNHTLNDIRNGLRDFSNEPEPNPLLHKGQEHMSSIRQRLPSPKTAEIGLRVQTSHHSLQNQNNIEHVKKENGHSIKTSSYSKQGVQNSSYSINMSQNIHSNPDKEVISGPPVLKWLQDKLIQDSQRLTDQSISMQTDQRTNLDALSSPDWASFNHFQSSRRSSSSNSDEHNNPAQQFKSFESNNKNKVDDYFNKASAFSRSSMTSAHRTGSFYTRNTRIQPYNSPNLNSVDDDPDAFFS